MASWGKRAKDLAYQRVEYRGLDIKPKRTSDLVAL